MELDTEYCAKKMREKNHIFLHYTPKWRESERRKEKENTKSLTTKEENSNADVDDVVVATAVCFTLSGLHIPMCKVFKRPSYAVKKSLIRKVTHKKLAKEKKKKKLKKTNERTTNKSVQDCWKSAFLFFVASVLLNPWCVCGLFIF